MTNIAQPVTSNLLAQFKLPWGGRFFEQVATPSDAQIDFAFNQLLTQASKIDDIELASRGLPGPTTCKVTRHSLPNANFGGLTVVSQYSVLIASFGRRPAFAPTSELLEYRYSYVVMCEFKVCGASGVLSQYLFVQRDLLGNPLDHMSPAIHKEIAAVNFMEPFLQPVQSGATFIAPRLERLSMKIMASARGELTRKIVEASDIEAAISSLGLHRVVPGSMTIAVPRGAGITTVSINPARQSVRSSSSRRPLKEVVEWAASGSVLFHKTKSVTHSCSSFIDGMAKPAGTIKGLIPRSVLLERYALDHILKQHADETNEVWAPRTKTPPGWNWKEILDALSELEVQSTPKRLDRTVIPDVGSEIEAYYDVLAPRFPSADVLRVCVSKQSCKLILSASLGGLVIPGSGETPSGLAELINKYKAFRVVFGAGDVLYCSDGAYKTSNLDLAVKQLLKIFESITALGNVHSEKGQASVGDTTFDPTSSFAVIADHFQSKCDILVCEDGPTEWCDFLAIATTQPSMSWIHAKVQAVENPKLKAIRKKAVKAAKLAAANNQPILPIPAKVTLPVCTSPSRSASALEEVIGQAVKNLARLRTPVSDLAFQNKRTDWVNNSCSLLQPASISRLVKAPVGTTEKYIDTTFQSIAEHPLAQLEVAIVVPNYSKADIEAEFNGIAAGKTEANVLQMFWLLSGFMHSCLEVGAKPVVYMQD